MRSWSACGVLPTSLYDHQAAEPHDDVSARLREHLTRPPLDLPPVDVQRRALSDYQDPAAIAMMAAWPMTESDRSAQRISCRTPNRRC